MFLLKKSPLPKKTLPNVGLSPAPPRRPPSGRLLRSWAMDELLGLRFRGIQKIPFLDGPEVEEKWLDKLVG